jgi:hypothetical protein
MGRQEPGARFDAALLGDVLERRYDAAIRHRPMRDRDHAPIGQCREDRGRGVGQQPLLCGRGIGRIAVGGLRKLHHVAHRRAGHELVGRDAEDLRKAPIGDAQPVPGVEHA